MSSVRLLRNARAISLEEKQEAVGLPAIKRRQIIKTDRHPMKILMITNVPNTRTGGAARSMHYLREEMNKQGHQVDLLFAEDVSDPLGWCGLTGLTFPLFMLLAVRRLTRATGTYDIISIHTLEGAVYVFLRKIFRRLPKCVIISYGADELRWELEKEEERLGFKRIGLRARLFYYNLIIRQGRYATRHSDHVIITGGQSEKDFYVNTYRMSPNDITVIPNGVAEECFMERDYHSTPKRLLFFGGWEWRKGRRYLIEAFTRVAPAFKDVTLSLVGTGESEPDIIRQFPQHIQPRVRVVPRVAAENVRHVYASHDIFVLPTLFESVPLVLPEAMASGMPIVTTRACGMQDIIKDGVSGFLVPPRDADALTRRITALLNDPFLCERLGQAAQRKAKEITWDNIARQTLQVYEKLLRQPNGIHESY